MENKNTFYITTTLPYVNAAPHIGFAFEIILADVIARYHKMLGKDVIFNFGTDEHGLKIYDKAIQAGMDPKQYVDEYAVKFEKLKLALNLSYNHFIRTTDEHHIKAAGEFWKLCKANGYIDKRFYKSKYCVGCELEKTDSELVDGQCPLHPNLHIQTIEEENYFFMFSKFRDKLLDFYTGNPDFVLPHSRFNEIKKFTEAGLNDFSISRLKSKLPWGVPVPGDDEQVMYVWFDALINYISTLGWPEDTKTFKDFWPGIQIAGKDNLRQQSAIWQAMLMAAELPQSAQILIHGFINVDGEKISKSVGNVIDPIKLAEEYGTDPVRYFLIREIPSSEDGDFTIKKLEDRYNGDLANNLGNLINRFAKLIETKIDGTLHRESKHLKIEVRDKIETAEKAVTEHLQGFRLHEAIAAVFALFNFGNEYISVRTPWNELHPDHLNETFVNLGELLVAANYLLFPFLPETSEKISKILGQDSISKDWNRITITEPKPLFPRIQ